MITPQPPYGAGAATRAVYATYHRDIVSHRRWTAADRTVTGVLVASTALGLSSIAFTAVGADVPLLASMCPIGLLVAWVMWRREILVLLGRRGEPTFPTQMLEIALVTDEAARNPRPFGALPPSMRPHRPEHR